jgi:hypothetical protein
MAFGQQSGPPATHRQIQTLTELLRAAGHADFRDARGPLGLTQRQAGGKFTRDEADALIARLEAEAEAGESGGVHTEPVAEPVRASAAAVADTAPAGEALRRTGPGSGSRRQAMLLNGLAELPAEALAAELQRRGWVVMEP